MQPAEPFSYIEITVEMRKIELELDPKIRIYIHHHFIEHLAKCHPKEYKELMGQNPPTIIKIG